MKPEELKKYRIPSPPQFPFKIREEERSDEYGVYSTGVFRYKGKYIVVNNEDGLWHLSVSANHTLGYYELKEVRYMFMPNDMHVAQIFPPREEFVNLHENCFHLYELDINETEKLPNNEQR